MVSLYLFIGVVLSQFFAAYFYSKGKNSYRKVFSAFILCVGIYLFGYIMVINNTNLQELIFWNQVQYFALPFISVLWLTVALLYTKTICTLNTKLAIALFFVPVVTFFMRLTNAWHHFFYASWELRPFLQYYAFHMQRGWWYYVHITYTMLCMFLTITVYYLGYRRKQPGYSKPQLMIFFLASLLPFIGIMLILILYETCLVDFSALIMPISILIIGYGILRYDFLEIKTLARETVFENSLVGMLILEAGFRVIDYNKAAKEFFGALNVSLDSYPIDHLLSEEPELLERFISETPQEFSLIMDNEKHFFEISTLPLEIAHEKKSKMLKSIRDITEKKKAQETLTFLATIDALSGLYNRVEFTKLAKREFYGTETNMKKLSLLMLDIDHFKNINDTFGHAAGDEAIQVMGNIIASSFRKTDFAGRLGGDEFIVLLKNASLAEAKNVAEKFRMTVERTKVVYENFEFNFTVSIGIVAISGDNYGSIEDVIRQADVALYTAKTQGRNSVATAELHDSARR